jgi:uncharacterized membrane protein
LFFGWNRSNGGGESNIVYGIGAGGNPALQFASWDGATYSERMRIDSSGNVGIGTSSPATKLDIYDSSTAIATTTILKLRSNAQNAASPQALTKLGFYGAADVELGYLGLSHNDGYSADNSVVILSSSRPAGVLRFDTNGSERMRIDASGNVGIGTDNPLTKIGIKGTGTFASAYNTNEFQIFDPSGNDQANTGFFIKQTYAASTPGSGVFTLGVGNSNNHFYDLAFATGGSERMRVTQSGGVSIGNTSDAGAGNLLVTGNIILGGALTEDVYAVVDAAGVPLSPTNGTIQTWTLGASRTPTAGTWDAGQSMTLMINDGTAYTITWSTLGVVWVGGTEPTLATTGFTIIELWKVGSTIYGALVGNVA